MKIRLSGLIKKIGVGFLIGGLVLVVVQYSGLIKAELNYQFRKNTSKEIELDEENKQGKDESNYIIPVDKEFGLIIPEIGVNISVVPDVSPTDSREYQQVLSQGVAHVRGSPRPDENGNTVIFAHSSDSFYNANRYNSVFYLLNKLKKGDKIYLVYKNELYEYKLSEKAIVSAEEVDYMASSDSKQLTLITCWPPGLTLKRLVVVAE